MYYNSTDTLLLVALLVHYGDRIRYAETGRQGFRCVYSAMKLH